MTFANIRHDLFERFFSCLSSFQNQQDRYVTFSLECFKGIIQKLNKVPITGFAPVPNPRLVFLPNWMLWTASDRDSNWRSVLQVTNSTPIQMLLQYFWIFCCFFFGISVVWFVILLIWLCHSVIAEKNLRESLRLIMLLIVLPPPPPIPIKVTFGCNKHSLTAL